MGKPYSIDLRERVGAEIASGQSRRAAARRYDVSASFAVKLADRISQTGSAEPARQERPPGGGKLAPYLAALLEWVEADPDITMPELAAKLEAEKAVKAHPASLSRVLLRAGAAWRLVPLPAALQPGPHGSFMFSMNIAFTFADRIRGPRCCSRSASLCHPETRRPE